MRPWRYPTHLPLLWTSYNFFKNLKYSKVFKSNYYQFYTHWLTALIKNIFHFHVAFSSFPSPLLPFRPCFFFHLFPSSSAHMLMVGVAPATMSSPFPAFFHLLLSTVIVCFYFFSMCLCFVLGMDLGCILAFPWFDLMGSPKEGIWLLYRVISATP